MLVTLLLQRSLDPNCVFHQKFQCDRTPVPFKILVFENCRSFGYLIKLDKIVYSAKKIVGILLDNRSTITSHHMQTNP